MAFHQLVQRLILLGADLGTPSASETMAPPTRLQPLIDALAEVRHEFDTRANPRIAGERRPGFRICTRLRALAAALHGALAQSEAYRLEAASETVARHLESDIQTLASLLQDSARPLELESLRKPVESALSVILQEHQDWYMLVQPHHLPLG